MVGIKIDYVTQKYGKAVAQICTFGTMAARAVVRDVIGLKATYGLADRLAS